jgi:glycosyltransferase involved in cell wall biosynthesis
MKLAYVSPLPPQRSGIADYSAALLPHLRPYCERLVAVVETGVKPVLPAGVFDAFYDASDSSWWAAERAIPLYHMGNHSVYHRYIYNLLQRFPGITVLHDGSLLPFINAVTLESGARANFVRELSFAEGAGGAALAWQYLRGEAVLTPEKHSMLARVCAESLGIIVHSDYMQRRVEQVTSQTPIVVIPMLDMTPVEAKAYSLAESRSRLGLEREAILLGAFGYIAPTKRLETVLHTLIGLRATYPQLRLICVGQIVEGYDFMERVNTMGLQDVVRVTGYVSPTEFALYLQAIDIGLNLRYPTWGEMSATLMRLLAAAKPVLVTDTASFSDLPDAVVCKVPYGADEASVLEALLRRLIADAAWREAIGNAACVYVNQYCDPAIIAQQYAAFIQSTTYDRFTVSS